ncbi:MAG: SDR family NAD(P)-dependent oxidoreductase, partial [Candidatus Acidiferrum sp.]
MSETPFSLAGKVAVVVGGTAGIGRAISLSFADAGADVVASGRRQEIVDAVAAELELKGRATLRVVSDVCQRSSIEELLQQTIQKFSKVDILVNCAAKIARAP